jgi:cytochrome c-type biogenesis protein CcmE
MTRTPVSPRPFIGSLAPALFFILLCVFTFGSLGTTLALANGLIEIAELLAHPEQYDHQDVVVTGKVMNVQLATNRQGQPAYGFLLQDPAGTLKVVSLGQLEVREGDQVIVEGVFSRLRQVGRTIVYNEIKAISVKPMTRLNPDLVG